MNTQFRYQLETRRLTGRRQQKSVCPQCGRPKCFVRYVDVRNGFCHVADHVGKCDHLHSCGYHYKPGEYYHDNPWASEPAARPDNRWTPPPLPPFQPLRMDYVRRSHSPRSTFWQWFSTEVATRLQAPSGEIQQVFDQYLIGATRRGEVIFWQIDQQGQVHGGHIMQYGPDGHRGGLQSWVHTRLIRKGLLPRDWTLRQCLFGEHLLSRRPEAHVCLVESEKTALVMALAHPQHLWLATAGCGGLSPERLKCLQGRRLTLFPDSGCHGKWLRQMRLTTGIDYHVSDRLEAYPPNTDLCDLLLQPPSSTPSSSPPSSSTPQRPLQPP